jgi:hypothetical protein
MFPNGVRELKHGIADYCVPTKRIKIYTTIMKP